MQEQIIMSSADFEKPDLLPWVDSIFTVDFDLEEGQVVDMVYPKAKYPEKLLKLMGYFSFPDSYVLSNEGDLYYCFQLKFEKESLYCYSLFTQKKDPTNQRGYYQKSIVLASRNRLVKIFRVIMKELGKAFNSGLLPSEFYSDFFNALNQNENPQTLIQTGEQFSLKILNSNLKVQFKRVYDPMFRFSERYSIL